MSLTLPVWLFIAASIAIAALVAFPLRLDAMRLALLSRLRSLTWGVGQDLRGTTRTLIVAAAVFVLVAGIGAVASYVGSPPKATDSGSPPHSGADGQMLAHLKDYARSIGTEEPVTKAATDKPLPDVNTMIERLAARLETAPEDVKGWRMLGWSYFNMGHYKQAASAYARALKLDPNSAEIKVSYEEAKAKASETASSSQTEAVDKGGDGPSGKKVTTSEATPPPRPHSTEIRAMVDGLADRLKSSPRDVDGWAHLIRSRVVLGEKEVAAAAFRKALEVFKDDAAATGKITAAATELGLKPE